VEFNAFVRVFHDIPEVKIAVTMSWLFKPAAEDDEESFLQEIVKINAIKPSNTRVFFIFFLSVIIVLTLHLQCYI